jgi:hypothetical protein
MHNLHGEMSVTLANLQGRIVKDANILHPKAHLTIPVGGISKGFYILRISQKGWNRIKPLVMVK